MRVSAFLSDAVFKACSPTPPGALVRPELLPRAL